jgi:aminoglycoside phosphotransferase (APT) family kinase protein
LPAADALVRIPAALRTLHALPAFPGAPFNTTGTFLLNEGPALDGFLHKFRASSILPETGTEELLACHQQLAAVYSRLEPDLAPSHNDLFKPDNMLFDGNRLWLVDWEAAFQNDRYAEVAVVANMIVTNEAEETAYLQQYFASPPDARAESPIAFHAAGRPHVLRHGFPDAGIVGTADRLERARAAVQCLSTALLGGGGRSGG